MIQRLFQTTKRHLSVLNNDTNWSLVTLADKVAEVIQEIRLIPNTTTKIASYTAHFGRKSNTQLSNITTKPSQNNLTYKNIKNFYLDKKIGLKQPILNAESIWNIETDSEPELDIRFNEDIPEEDSASDNSTLQNVKKKAAKRKHTSHIKIIPDKLMLTFGDKTTTISNTRKQVARKTIARRTNEPRGTLNPLLNIIPDGTITNYTPTTITLDTHNRKNTVIRKNDLAIVNETKPRLIHFIACKNVREYKRNQEKIKEFLLTDKKTNKKTQPKEQQNECFPGPSTQMDQPGPGRTQWTQPAKNPKQPKRKGTAPSKRTYKPNKDFDQRSKEAALAQTKLEKARQRQKDKVNSPRIQLDTKKLHKDKSVEVINLSSDSSQGSPLQIFTSDNPNAFMYAPSNNKDNSPTKRDAKIDKIIRRITNSPKKTPVEPEIEQIITIIPASTSTPIGNNTKTLQHIDNKKPPQPTGNNNKDTS